jgi:hypothetical protein
MNVLGDDPWPFWWGCTTGYAIGRASLADAAGYSVGLLIGLLAMRWGGKTITRWWAGRQPDHRPHP